jgi:hypothetical protein
MHQISNTWLIFYAKNNISNTFTIFLCVFFKKKTIQPYSEAQTNRLVP